MDNSELFRLMLNKAMKNHPKEFSSFDPTKNVQDQLQEMVISLFKGNCYWMMEECYKFMKLPYPVKSESMEQVWLTFTMREKFGKVWDGASWIEAKIMT